jgi:hypothetical protein
MHRHECNTHNFLFDSENQTKLFSYTIFPVKKINVGKVLKLWENCYVIIVSIHILKLEIPGCDTVPFLVASDELQRRRREDSSVGWTDGPLEETVGLSDDQVQTRQRRAKIHAVAPDEPTGLQRFIRRSRGSYQRGFGRDVFSTGWSDGALEHSVRTVVSTVMCGGGNS